MSNPIEIANDIKAAILELAAGRDYPDLLEAVDSLLIRSSNKGYAQGVIDGKVIASPAPAHPQSDIGKAISAPEPSSAVKADELHEFKLRLSEYGVAMAHRQGEKARVLADVLSSMVEEAKALSDSEGSRAVTYLRRARTAERELAAALSKSEPRAPVLTDEQIERIYTRYGGDMMNCARAIERAALAAASQPTATKGMES